MSGFYAIFKKEFKSYFFSPIAYVVITIFLIINGYIFYSNISIFSIISMQALQNPQMASGLNVTEGVLRPLFGDMGIILVFMIPLLTMRLFAEEKRSGTIELLLTYPLRDSEVILGKFVAAISIFIVMLAISLLYPIIISIFGDPETGPIITGYLGLILMGSAFISLGIFASSLTENQIVAAVISFGLLLLFWVIGWTSSIAGPTLRSIITHLSLIEHFLSFSRGILDTHDILFYLLFVVFWLYLTLKSLELRKWRGKV